MHANLAPGESLLPGTRAAAEALLAEPDVAAVLVPLVPAGAGPLPRAARRYLAAWDRRFVHRQNFYAPASRCLTRAPLPGPRNADAAPFLAGAVAGGARVEALPEAGVASPVGHDLARWIAHFRSEGEGWGALASRDPSYAGFLPALRRGAWWRHNVLQVSRRTIEELEAVRSPAPLPWLLHLAREAAFTGGSVRGHGQASLGQRSSR